LHAISVFETILAMLEPHLKPREPASQPLTPYDSIKQSNFFDPLSEYSRYMKEAEEDAIEIKAEKDIAKASDSAKAKPRLKFEKENTEYDQEVGVYYALEAISDIERFVIKAGRTTH